MEVFQALTLMFMFGMFILALLTYIKKPLSTPARRGTTAF